MEPKTRDRWAEAAKRIIKQSDAEGGEELWEELARELAPKMPFFFLDATLIVPSSPRSCA